MIEFLQNAFDLLKVLIAFAAFLYLIRRLILLDAEIGERIARTSNAVPTSQGLVVFTAQPVGLFRWRIEHEVHRALLSPMPAITVPVNLNGQQVSSFISADPALQHALDVINQSRRKYGEDSERIIPASEFVGSPNTWQAGKDYLDAHLGTYSTSKGSFCGAPYPTLKAVMKKLIPSPTPQGNGQQA